MSRILVLRWEEDAPRLGEGLLRELKLLPLPSRYAVHEYMNVDGKSVIVGGLSGRGRSWTTTQELLIEGGLIVERPIASIVIEFHRDAIIDTSS